MLASLFDRAWTHFKTLHTRITFTRCTLAFVLASVGFCFAQALVQSLVHSVEADASRMVASVLAQQHDASLHGQYAYLQYAHGQYGLSLCSRLPHRGDKGGCHEIFNSAWPAHPAHQAHMNSTRRAEHVEQLSVHGNHTANYVSLNPACVKMLVYPDQVYKNATREASALIGLHFWLLLAAFWAIGYESVPQILAAFFTRLVATGWSAYCIWRTLDIQRRWDSLFIASNSPCNQNLFPHYLSQRLQFQIPDLILNVVALVLFSFLSWRLIRVYSKQTLARVGTTPQIQRIYGYFMVVFACLQLSGFWLMAVMGLWLDQVVNGALSKIGTYDVIYKFQSTVTIILFFPWMVLGWWALTRESKRGTMAFFGWNVVLIVGWALDLYSLAFRWTFVQWPFFGCVVTSAFLVLIVTSIFTVVCYRHFECGFAHYLRADRELARTGFEPEVFARATEDPEKAAEAGTEPPSRFSFESDLQADAKPLKVGWSLP